ncbi:hypothetical protein BsWGS_23145 [Bradybaena similaris]
MSGAFVAVCLLLLPVVISQYVTSKPHLSSSEVGIPYPGENQVHTNYTTSARPNADYNAASGSLRPMIYNPSAASPITHHSMQTPSHNEERLYAETTPQPSPYVKTATPFRDNKVSEKGQGSSSYSSSLPKYTASETHTVSQSKSQGTYFQPRPYNEYLKLRQKLFSYTVPIGATTSARPHTQITYSQTHTTPYPQSGSEHQTDYPQSGSEHQTDYPQSGSEHQTDYPQSGSERQTDYPQSGSEHQTDYPQSGSEHYFQTHTTPNSQSGSEHQTDYPKSGSEHQTDYPKSGSEHQTDYPQSGSEHQTDYPPSGSEHQTDYPQSGSEHQTDYPQSGSERQTDYPQSGSEHQTDYPQSGSEHQTDYPQSGSEHQTDYPQSGSEHQTDYPQSGSEHQTDYPQSGSEHQTDYPQSGSEHYFQTHTTPNSQSGSEHQTDYPKSGSEHQTDYPKSGSEHQTDYPQSGSEHYSKTHTTPYPQSGSEHQTDYPQSGSEHQTDYPQSGSEHYSKTHTTLYPQSGSEHQTDYPQSGSDHPTAYLQSGPDSKQDYLQSGSDSKQDYPQSASDSKQDYPQSGSDYKQDYPQSGSDYKQDYPQSGSDSKSAYPQLGPDSKPAYSQSGTDSKPAYSKSGSVREAVYPQLGPDYRDVPYKKITNSQTPTTPPYYPNYNKPTPSPFRRSKYAPDYPESHPVPMPFYGRDRAAYTAPGKSHAGKADIAGPAYPYGGSTDSRKADNYAEKPYTSGSAHTYERSASSYKQEDYTDSSEVSPGAAYCGTSYNKSVSAPRSIYPTAFYFRSTRYRFLLKILGEVNLHQKSVAVYSQDEPTLSELGFHASIILVDFSYSTPIFILKVAKAGSVGCFISKLKCETDLAYLAGLIGGFIDSGTVHFPHTARLSYKVDGKIDPATYKARTTVVDFCKEAYHWYTFSPGKDNKAYSAVSVINLFGIMDVYVGDPSYPAT